MRRIISCQFNIDTACVDVEYEDGFVLSIYTLAYVGLVMSGKSEEYLKAVTQ